MKLLIVDDEKLIRDLIRKYALYEGYTVDEAANGSTAVALCQKNTYSLVIMDVMMPEMDGFSACQEIRKCSDVPVLMLSARGEEYDRIRGFELGVDDYVVKPFSPRELMMRVSAITKRSGTNKQEMESVMIPPDLLVDYSARLVSIGGRALELSPKQYDLLAYLVRNRGIALTRDKLLDEVWGCNFYGDERTLDTHIKLLRKELGDYAKYITTLRGVGYRFEK